MLQGAGRPASAGAEASTGRAAAVPRAERKKAVREARKGLDALAAAADAAERGQDSRALAEVGGRL